MKFLPKNQNSPILAQGLTYGHDASKNRVLRETLLQEQHWFCAYTERVISRTDAVELEHFDPSIKYKDDYYNYYVVLPWANRAKLRKEYRGSLFFQDAGLLRKRMTYSDGEFCPIGNDDAEVVDIINFLGFNEEALYTQRKDHLDRLRFILDSLFGSNLEAWREYLQDPQHRQELSFPTAIEAEFGIDLTEIIQTAPAP